MSSPNEPSAALWPTCASLEASVGREAYHRLLCSAEPTRKRGRLLFWQEELFRKFAAETGIAISTVEEFNRLLDAAIARFMSDPPLPEADRESWHFNPAPRACPKGISQKQWETILKKQQEHAEKRELAADAIMRQAKAWHNEALNLFNRAESLQSQGNTIFADETRRQAFDLARCAADSFEKVYEQEELVSSCHRTAALYALACDEFQEAVRLSRGMVRGVDSDDDDALTNRLDEIHEEIRKIDLEAEAVRKRIVGDRLQEITFIADWPSSPSHPNQLAAFSPNSTRLASAAGNKRVHVYEISTQKLLQEFEIKFTKDPPRPGVLRHMNLGMCYSPDGEMIALAGSEGSVFLWDVAAEATRQVLTGHAHNSYNVAFSPDGRHLASAGCFGMRIWDARTGKKGSTFARDVHNSGLAFSPDSKRLAWGRGEGGRLTVLDVDSRTEIYSVKAHRDIVQNLSFSPCGHLLATACFDRTFKLLEAANGREIVTLHGGHSKVIAGNSIAFSPDGKLLATASGSHVLLWSLPSCECIFAIPDSHWTGWVRFSPDGKYLAAKGNQLRLWRVEHLLSLPKDLSSLKGKMGTVVRPSNPQTAFEQAVKPSPAPKKMPPPQHLQNCTVAIKSRCTRKAFAAHVQCPCGGKKFRLLHSGGVWEDDKGDKRPSATNGESGSYLVIKATCAACQAEHLLFDMDFHGWNGFVCRTDAHLRPRPDLIHWHCTKCGQQEHTATVGVFSEGRQDAIEESGEFLTEANWQEGFGSIGIATKCCGCGHKAEDWLSFETM